MIKIDFPPFERLVNKPFKDLLKNDDRYILLYGGRLSGKSVASIRYLIIRCLIEPYFKCILVRKVYDTIKDSMFEAIKYEVDTLGLNDLFTFKENPMTITCINGNVFICKGLDKPDKLKSIKEPNFVWYEEGNQITESDFITVTTSVRSDRARLIQEVFSFNPESDVNDYENFWIYKYFFQGETKLSFRSKLKISDQDGNEIETNYTVIHSTYKDNPHAKKESIATIEKLKTQNPFYYNVYALGLWGNKDVKNKAYKTFNQDLIKRTKYNPDAPLYLSFDENTIPYITLLVFQVEIDESGNKTINVLNEFCLSDPLNTLKDLCLAFETEYFEHKSGGVIYGDRTSLKNDTKTERGDNFYSLALDYLKRFRFYTDLPTANPSQRARILFLNELFSGGVEGVSLKIDPNCHKLIDDFMNVQTDSDGSKLKKRERDKASGQTFEKFGHTSDAFEYFVCRHFEPEYQVFQNGGAYDFEHKFKLRKFTKTNRL